MDNNIEINNDSKTEDNNVLKSRATSYSVLRIVHIGGNALLALWSALFTLISFDAMLLMPPLAFFVLVFSVANVIFSIMMIKNLLNKDHRKIVDITNIFQLMCLIIGPFIAPFIIYYMSQADSMGLSLMLISPLLVLPALMWLNVVLGLLSVVGLILLRFSKRSKITSSELDG